MSWPVHVDALLIDLDGTLVDSHAAIMRGWQRWADRYGVDLELVCSVMPGRTALAVMRQLRPDLPDPVLARDQDELLDQQAADTGDVTALPGAGALLAAVPADRWALVTAGSDRLARARLRAAGLPEPAVLIGCDTVSTSKPDPAGYLLAAGKLGVEPGRCLVIEDAAAGIAAGRAAGMRVLAVPPPGADRPAPGADLTVPNLLALRVENPGPLTLTLMEPT